MQWEIYKENNFKSYFSQQFWKTFKSCKSLSGWENIQKINKAYKLRVSLFAYLFDKGKQKLIKWLEFQQVKNEICMKNCLFVQKIDYPFPSNVCAFFGGEAPTKFKNLVSNFYSPNVKDKRLLSTMCVKIPS